jgi:hypothetical protein
MQYFCQMAARIGYKHHEQQVRHVIEKAKQVYNT